MISVEKTEKKLHLEYPCDWEYKIILDSNKEPKDIIKKIIGDRKYKLKNSKISRNGKYKSCNINMLVHNDDDRKVIYEELKKNTNIKMVL